ncbi:hypothetical protein F4824DRAFT_514155 [Ustulina deusta]|nr:hypothetical protein F4824DRAFT_514155 [Ustulina deusta]
MEACVRDAFSFAADKMRQRAMVDPKWAQIELHTIVEALHKGLLVLLPQNQAQLYDFNFWLDLQRKAARMFDLPNGRFTTEPSQDQTHLTQVAAHQSSKNTTKQAATINTADFEEERHSDVSDAISDTSFTPPKKLGKFAQIDKNGRRHIVLPRALTNHAPKKQRFVKKDNKGRRHLLPPPGFHGKAPRPVQEPEPEPKKLTFERKRDFKKPNVKCGGISLAVIHEKGSRAERAGKSRSAAKRPDIPNKPVPFNREGVPKRHVPSDNQPTMSAARDGKTAHWESAFLKGVFEIEEDLLYSSRWPASTF